MVKACFAAMMLFSILPGCGERNLIDGREGNQFSMITYNVAGLPEGGSESNPERNTPLISERLQPYDLVVVQEDFCFHEELVSRNEFPHESEPEFDPGCTVFFGDEADLGDGLNRLSVFPFSEFERIDWDSCSGLSNCSFDCLTNKGFSFGFHRFSDEASVLVVNLHLDAGECDEDFQARDAQIKQLLASLDSSSMRARPVIVAGDFNTLRSRQRDGIVFSQMQDAGFRQACEELECGEDLLDQIWVRDGSDVGIRIRSREVPDGFRIDGEDLSDHLPVQAELELH